MTAMIDVFSERIEQALEVPPKRARSPYEKFGYLDNPFPTKTYPLWQRFHNQEEVKSAFEEQLLRYISGDQKNSTFFLLGGNRVGKTHFLKHHYLALEDIFRKREIYHFPPIFIAAPPSDFLQNYRDIILQLNRHYEDITKEEFFLQFSNLIKNQDDLIGKMLKDDLWRAFRKLQQTAKRTSLIPREDFVGGVLGGVYPIFLKWLEGVTLEQREKRILGISSPLKTSSSSIYVLSQIIQMGRELELIKGLIVFLDEFEVLWPTVRAERRARYLQDLRHFIDEIPHGLFLVVAMTDDTEASLREEYRALHGRLSSPTAPYILRPIHGTDDAWGYAEYFLEEARKVFEDTRGSSFQGNHIISRAEVIETLEKVSKEQLIAFQGDFFDALHELVEEKVR